MYLCKKLTGRTLVEIGKKFGGKGHDTVIHALHKVEQEIKDDPEVARDIELLTRYLEYGDVKLVSKKPVSPPARLVYAGYDPESHIK
jgi:hypothetical protein